MDRAADVMRDKDRKRDVQNELETLKEIKIEMEAGVQGIRRRQSQERRDQDRDRGTE